MLQEITIIGRLGRDASVREMENGDKVINFTIAANRKRRDAEKTTWYEVSTFNYERYKNMYKYLTKGSNVIVIGELDAGTYNGRDGETRLRLSVDAHTIAFNDGGTSGSTSETQTTSKPKAKAKSRDEEDDMPADEEIDMSASRRKSKKVEKVDDDMPSDDYSDNTEDSEMPF